MTALFRYYQAMLKSIPATTQMAEQMWLDKNELVYLLPDTSENLKLLIKNQIDLALKIEKHLSFFIKWDKKAVLSVPLILRNTLKRSVQPLSRYVDLLNNEVSALEGKDFNVFNKIFFEEETIYNKLNSFFDKPLYRTAKKSLFAGFYNCIYFSVRGFVSPIAKFMQIAFLMLVFSLPSIMNEITSVIKPVQASRISAPAIVNIRDLVNELASVGWQVRMIEGKSSKAPTIILKEDEHIGPKPEIRFVNYILSKYGINFVATEGWAGYEQDKERGYTVLNAEEDFVRNLIRDSNFYKMGLEDADLQENALKMAALHDYYYLTYLLSEMSDQIGVLEKQIENLKAKKSEIEAKNEFTDEDRSDIRSYQREIKRKQRHVDSLKERLALYQQVLQEMPHVYDVFKELGWTWEELIGLHDAMLSGKSWEEVDALCDQIAVYQRSQLWASKVAGAVKARNIASIIVVMGYAHTESFLAALQGIGDFNIVIVAPYKK